MRRKITERVLRVLGLIGLPADLRTLYNVVIAALPTVLAGAFAQAQEASVPVLVLLVLCSFVVFFLASIPATTAVARWRTRGRQETGLPMQPAAADESLPCPLPRQYPEDTLSKSHLPNLSFRVVDLVAPEQVMNKTNVKDKTFYKCTIHGPALLTLGGTRFTGNNEFFSAVPQLEYPEAMMYDVDLFQQPKTWPSPQRTWFAGTVGMEGCVFHDCTFVDIGFLHNGPVLAKLKRYIEGGGDVEI